MATQKNKKAGGRSRETGATVAKSIEIDASLMAALDVFMEKTKRKFRQSVELAIEEMLQRERLWPPDGAAT